jgi:hypothetical protein
MEHGPLGSFTSKIWGRNRNDNSIMHTSQDSSIFHVFFSCENETGKGKWIGLGQQSIRQKTCFIRRNRYLKAFDEILIRNKLSPKNHRGVVKIPFAPPTLAIGGLTIPTYA